jgi:hypothetical protein
MLFLTFMKSEEMQALRMQSRSKKESTFKARSKFFFHSFHEPLSAAHTS